MNLSQQKRERLLNFIKELKSNNSFDEKSLIELNEIENELNGKKYGLVWEEHEEKVDAELKMNVPIFNDCKNLSLISDKEKKYNFLLEGDNLESLYLLQKTHKNSIDMIYIDPPYNTGKKEDFVYNDDYVISSDNYRHSKWLSFMYNRLRIAQTLLNEKGVIFISIDDNELANIKLLCDEIFNPSNMVAILSVEINPKGRKNSKFISLSNDYCLIYCKNKSKAEFVENIPKNASDLVKDENGDYVHNSGKRVLVGEGDFNDIVEDYKSDKHYSVYYNDSQDLIEYRKEKDLNEVDEDLLDEGYTRYISFSGDTFRYNTYSLKRFKELYDEDALEFKNGKIYEKNFSTTIRMKSILVNREYIGIVNNEETNVKIDVKTTSAGTHLKELFDTKKPIFSNPKNVEFIRLLLTLFENKDITVLDFFAGSGTTGEAVLEQNNSDNGKRKFILATNNEISDKVIKDFAKNNNYISDKRKFVKFKETNEYKEMLTNPELLKLGLCQHITYQRLKTVITGKRADGSKYSDGLPANLKYFKTDFVSKSSKNLSKELTKHVKELIELEWGISIDKKVNLMVMTEEELDKIEANWDKLKTTVKSIYRARQVVYTGKQKQLFKNINNFIIPDYYFNNELKEVGENW